MARSRKTPPLFEVMRETDRKPEAGRVAPAPSAAGVGNAPSAAAAGDILPRPVEMPAKPVEPPTRLRLKTEHPAAGNGAAGAGHDHHGSDAESNSFGGSGMVLSLPVLLGGVGVLVAVVAIVATIAFRAGATRERNELLTDDGAPPVTSTDGAKKSAEPVAPPDDSSRREASGANGGTRPTGQTLPVFGDEPREQGKNYLVVETMMFDDAMAAAQFLTDNGVPSVVLAPEGTDPAKLSQQPRGLWQVIVRQGFTRDEFRARATESQALRENVKKLGRRWKQDHRGSSDFSTCVWDKFGK